MGRRRRRPKVVIPEVVQNSQVPAAIQNGGNSLVSNMQNLGFAFPSGYPNSAQISQPGTIFHNMRWWLVSNLRQMLSEAFVELGLVQNIVCVPVDDALRGGVEISTKQLDESQIAELTAKVDEQGDIVTAGEAGYWNRLYGGGAIIIFTDQDPLDPLDIDSIDENSELEFRAVDMWELFYDHQTVGEYDVAIQSEEFEFYDYYGEKIHKSRVIPIKGVLAPAFIRPRLRGWGVSVVETLVRSINQYLKASDLVYEVLDEFKVDVYKINNLVSSNFGPGGADGGSVRDRVELVNWQKNFQNAVVLDAEDDWGHKQLNFQGLADVQIGIRMQVASDMRIPMTKLFGMSAQGFNSGEDDIEVYNGMVESSVRNKLKYPLLQMVKIRCQELFGFVPDDLSIAFKPLRMLGAVDEEGVKTQKFNRALQAAQAGLLSPRLFADICNRGNLFDVKIDTKELELGLDTGLEDETAREEPEFSPRTSRRPKDDNDDGADRSSARGISRKGQKKAANRRISNDDWKESDHPRADDGKFTKGGSGSPPKKGEGSKSSDGGSVEFEAKDLSKEQKSALGEYKSVGYGYVNGHLRGNKVRDPEAAEHLIKQLDGAIETSKIKTETTVYRGMTNQVRLRELGADAVGEEFNMKTYWSTSPNEKTARQFAMEGTSRDGVMFEIRLPAGQKALELTAGTKEEEVLLPRNMRYKVVEYKKGSGKRGAPTLVLEPIQEKAKNKIIILPTPFTRGERLKRVFNSVAFDLKSYNADGGDNWIDSGREGFFEHPDGVDQELWGRARLRSKEIFEGVNWKFTAWMYRKLGGRFAA